LRNDIRIKNSHTNPTISCPKLFGLERLHCNQNTFIYVSTLVVEKLKETMESIEAFIISFKEKQREK
jgi:hypothetical protein